jgi:hypothetical protein
MTCLIEVTYRVLRWLDRAVFQGKQEDNGMGLEIYQDIPEEKLLALVMFGEARNQPVEGQIAVGAVIRTRTIKRNKNYKAVMLEPKQFSCLDAQPEFLIHTYKSYGYNLDSKERRLYLQCTFLADGLYRHLLIDNVSGADHFYNPKLATPKWAKEMTVTKIIEDHIFLRS